MKKGEHTGKSAKGEKDRLRNESKRSKPIEGGAKLEVAVEKCDKKVKEPIEVPAKIKVNSDFHALSSSAGNFPFPDIKYPYCRTFSGILP